MTAVVGSDAAVDSGTSRTLEEQLRRTHGHLCLAADLVDLQAGAPDAGWPAGGLGFPETTIGRCLNHARYTVTAKHYNQHLYLAETRAALEAWDGEIDRIIKKGKERKRVLRFQGRR